VEFLIIAVVVSAIGIAIVLWRNRRPKGLHAGLDQFQRGMSALAPDDESGARDGRRPDSGR
jgi:hypothetical protein